MLKKFISLAAVAASIFGCSGSGSSDGPSGPGAATLEDLPNCTENREGEEATLADNGFVYRCEDGAWEFVSAPLDTASTLDDLPNCTGKIDGDSVLVKGENAVFQCTGGKWKKVRSLGMNVATADDLVSCTSRRDGDSAYVADVHSIYSCTDGKWNKVATLMDTVKTADGMTGCSDKYDGDSTYVQSDSSVYICMQKKWRLLGESVATEDDMKNCTESREDMRIFVVDIRKSLICRDGKWFSFKLADLIEDEETEAPAESSSSGNKWEELPLSSSVKSSSSSAGSSSSVASSSSVKSSSSVASSSSVVESSSSVNQSSSSVASSSSIASSSSEKSSSSVASSSSVKYGTLTDSRDGQTYKIVTIGTQTWMAENLNYAYTGVKYNYSSYTSDSTSWCYDNKASNCDKYGRLYTWSAVMDSAAQFNVNAGTKCGDGKTCTPNSPHRGICPEGWHVPTNEEYSTLYTYIGGFSTAGSLLKSTSGWYNSGNGTDKYGFSVLPAGGRRLNGNFYSEGSSASLWSASEYSGSYAWDQYFRYDNDDAYQANLDKYYGRSLRCLRDSSDSAL